MSCQQPGPRALSYGMGPHKICVLKGFFGWDDGVQVIRPPGAAVPCPGERMSTKQAKSASVRTG